MARIMEFILNLLLLRGKFLTTTAAETLHEAIKKCMTFKRKISVEYNSGQIAVPFENMLDFVNYNSRQYSCEDGKYVVTSEIQYLFQQKRENQNLSQFFCKESTDRKSFHTLESRRKNMEETTTTQNVNITPERTFGNNAPLKNKRKAFNEEHIVDNLRAIVKSQELLFKNVIKLVDLLEKGEVLGAKNNKLLRVKKKLVACTDILSNNPHSHKFSNMINNIIDEEVTRCRLKLGECKTSREISLKAPKPQGLAAALESSKNHQTEKTKKIEPKKKKTQQPQVHPTIKLEKKNEVLRKNAINQEVQAASAKFLKRVKSEPLMKNPKVSKKKLMPTRNFERILKQVELDNKHFEKLIQINEEYFKNFEDALWHSETTTKYLSLEDDYRDTCKCAFYNKRQFVATEQVISRKMKQEEEAEHFQKVADINRSMFQITERKLLFESVKQDLKKIGQLPLTEDIIPPMPKQEKSNSQIVKSDHFEENNPFFDLIKKFSDDFRQHIETKSSTKPEPNENVVLEVQEYKLERLNDNKPKTESLEDDKTEQNLSSEPKPSADHQLGRLSDNESKTESLKDDDRKQNLSSKLEPSTHHPLEELSDNKSKIDNLKDDKTEQDLSSKAKQSTDHPLEQLSDNKSKTDNLKDDKTEQNLSSKHESSTHHPLEQLSENKSKSESLKDDKTKPDLSLKPEPSADVPSTSPKSTKHSKTPETTSETSKGHDQLLKGQNNQTIIRKNELQDFLPNFEEGISIAILENENYKFIESSDYPCTDQAFNTKMMKNADNRRKVENVLLHSQILDKPHAIITKENEISEVGTTNTANENTLEIGSQNLDLDTLHNEEDNDYVTKAGYVKKHENIPPVLTSHYKILPLSKLKEKKVTHTPATLKFILSQNTNTKVFQKSANKRRSIPKYQQIPPRLNQGRKNEAPNNLQTQDGKKTNAKQQPKQDSGSLFGPVQDFNRYALKYERGDENITEEENNIKKEDKKKMPDEKSKNSVVPDSNERTAMNLIVKKQCSLGDSKTKPSKTSVGNKSQKNKDVSTRKNKDSILNTNAKVEEKSESNFQTEMKKNKEKNKKAKEISPRKQHEEEQKIQEKGSKKATVSDESTNVQQMKNEADMLKKTNEKAFDDLEKTIRSVHIITKKSSAEAPKSTKSTTKSKKRKIDETDKKNLSTERHAIQFPSQNNKDEPQNKSPLHKETKKQAGKYTLPKAKTFSRKSSKGSFQKNKDSLKEKTATTHFQVKFSGPEGTQAKETHSPLRRTTKNAMKRQQVQNTQSQIIKQKESERKIQANYLKNEEARLVQLKQENYLRNEEARLVQQDRFCKCGKSTQGASESETNASLTKTVASQTSTKVYDGGLPENVSSEKVHYIMWEIDDDAGVVKSLQN